MMFAYKPRHFAAHEVVCPQTYKDRGEMALHLMNAQVLETADILRELFGPAFINTYALSATIKSAYGVREESGLRLPESKWYKPYSQHSRGNALDMVFMDIPAEKIRQAIINGDVNLPYNVVLEKSVNWLHVACANYGEKVTLVNG